VAAAGVKPVITYGETDNYRYNLVRDPVHVHDFNATLLHLMGIEHTKRTYRFQGCDFRLTDVHGKVVLALLA
jgi:arylsulfatase A-like enzyme